MSDWSEVPQYNGGFDDDVWLNDIYSKMDEIANTPLKKTDGNTSDMGVKKIKSKKTEIESKKKDAKKNIDKTSESNTQSPNHDNWLGYIIAVFINETITQSIECCPGCKDSKNSPLFHSHQHSGLLEKLYMFAPSVKAMLISKLSVLVADYVSKYPDPEIYDDAGRKVLTNIGRTFIRQCNPTFVYYSKYLTPCVDEVVTTTPILKTQPMTLKRVANTVQKSTDSSKRMKTQ